MDALTSALIFAVGSIGRELKKPRGIRSGPYESMFLRRLVGVLIPIKDGHWSNGACLAVDANTGELSVDRTIAAITARPRATGYMAGASRGSAFAVSPSIATPTASTGCTVGRKIEKVVPPDP